MVQRISLATDFSPESNIAFHHALAMACAYRCQLDLLHVHPPHAGDTWDHFPHVRETLVKWGWLTPDADENDVERQTGVRVKKVEIKDDDVSHGLASFVSHHKPGLVVASSHGRSGVNLWMTGSVTEEVTVKTRTPTLIIGPRAPGFVNANTGEIHLASVLFPVAVKPDPQNALDDLFQILGKANTRVHLVHISNHASPYDTGSYNRMPVHVIEGPVVEGILEAARTYRADMIAMATEGRHGLLDALRGSTTNRVLHGATCPILALPS